MLKVRNFCELSVYTIANRLITSIILLLVILRHMSIDSRRWGTSEVLGRCSGETSSF